MYSQPTRATLMFSLLIVASSVTAQEVQRSATAPDAAERPPRLRCFEGFDYSPTHGVLLGNSGGIGFDQSWHPAGYNAGMPEAYRIVGGSLGSLTPADDDAYMRIGALQPRPPVAETPFELSEHLQELREQKLFIQPGETPQPRLRIPFRRKRPYSIRGIGRPLADPIEIDETITLYFATLFRPDGELGSYIGFYLDGTDHQDLFIGTAGDTRKYWMERRGGSGKVMTDVTSVSGQVDLLVIKAELQPGPDVFTLYINPDTNAAEPDSGTVKRDLDVGRVDQIVLYSQGAFSMDDFRIVEDFAGLTSYSLPGSAVGGFHRCE